MPHKVWAVGEEVLAADFNTFVQEQVTPTFSSFAQLQSDWPNAPLGASAITTDNMTRYTHRVAGAAGWKESFPRYATVAELKADTTSWIAMVAISGVGYVVATRKTSTPGSAWTATYTVEKPSKTCDANGAIYFAASEFGFTTIDYAIATCVWSTTVPSNQWCGTRIVTNQVQVRIFAMNTTTGNVALAVNGTVAQATLTVCGQF